MRFFVRPKGFAKPRPRNAPPGRFCPAGRKARGTGCSNPFFYCPIKSAQNKKSSTPIRCCSWCSKAIQIRTIFYNGLQWENQRTAFNSFRKSDTHRPMVFAISWWASVVLAYNSLMVAVMGCMRIRLTGLYTASTTAASTTTTITARQPHGTCHAAPK